MWILVYFPKSPRAPDWFEASAAVNADSKQEPVIGRSGHIVKWEGRKTERGRG